jgi:hypothetical protein
MDNEDESVLVLWFRLLIPAYILLLAFVFVYPRSGKRPTIAKDKVFEHIKGILFADDSPVESFLVGGSWALRKYTERDFPVGDVDIYVPAFHDADGGYVVEDEVRCIKKVVQGDVVVKYTRDWIAAMERTEDDIEAYDRNIIATITCHKDIDNEQYKLQFVIVSVSARYLSQWYCKTSDLPVHYCLTRDGCLWCDETFPLAKEAKTGVLKCIGHADRRACKYMAKGFIVSWEVYQ